MSLAPPPRSATRQIQRRLGRSSRAARLHLGFTIAFGAIEIAIIIAQATLLATVITEAFLGGADLAAVTPDLIWLAALSVARGLVAAGFESAGKLGAAKVMGDLRRRLVTQLLRNRPGALAAERRGELAATAVQGADSLESYFAKYLPQVAVAAIAPAAILAWTLSRDLQATLILAVTFPLIPVFMILIGKRAERRTRLRWNTLTRLSSHFLDVVSGLETLRAHGRAQQQVETIATAGERYRAETMGTLRVGFLSALVLELLAMLGTALVAAAIGVQLANGSLGLEAGLTVLLLAPELYMPLRNVGAQYHASADAMAAAERIYEVLDLPPAVSIPEHPRRCPDPALERIAFREVSYSYPSPEGAEERDPVLRDVSFNLEPGETLALVGASGCGKSTLASLLVRLADPSAGGILCGGVDLREVDPREWQRRIASIAQRPMLFAASVADNVRLADPAAPIERVRAALADAGGLEFAEALPEGLETQIGDGGRKLSAGQEQRIALARAFLRDASLVVLDEPTANLDSEAAAAVATAAERLVADRTALVVVHRPELARLADRVLELRDGRIVEIDAAQVGT